MGDGISQGGLSHLAQNAVLPRATLLERLQRDLAGVSEVLLHGSLTPGEEKVLQEAAWDPKDITEQESNVPILLLGKDAREILVFGQVQEEISTSLFTVTLFLIKKN